MGEEFAHIDADSTRTDHRDGPADGPAVADRLGVREHLRVVDARDGGTRGVTPVAITTSS